MGYRIRWLGDALVLMILFAGSTVTMMIGGLGRRKSRVSGEEK